MFADTFSTIETKTRMSETKGRSFTPIFFKSDSVSENSNWSVKEAGWYIFNGVGGPKEGPYSTKIDTRDLTAYFNYKYENSKVAQLLFLTPSILPVRKVNQDECKFMVQMMCNGWSMVQDLTGEYQLIPNLSDRNIARVWPNLVQNFLNGESGARTKVLVENKTINLAHNWATLATLDVKTW